jgi:6-pyruvoyl-tetrahydropterin synthase
MNEVKIELFKEITDDMLKTYIAKNSDYGDSFTKTREEYPNAIIIRLMDKLERLKTLLENKATQQVKDESIVDTLKDLSNYSIMEIIEMKLDEAYEDVLKQSEHCTCEECEEIYTSTEQTKETLIQMLKDKYGEDIQIKFVEVKE